MWLIPRRHVLLALVAFTVLTVVASHELTASPQRIKDAVNEGVPGFDCPDIRVETPSGSRDRHSHIMRAGLRMPHSCLVNLRHRLVTSSLYRADRCSLVDQCWVRESEQKIYTFTFHANYVGFHFEER